MQIRTFSRLACACALAASGLVSSALAAPIVAPGSTFDIRLFGDGILTTVSLAPVTFDGVAQSFTGTFGPNSRNLRVSESDTDLGNGQHRITVEVLSDGDMFPGTTMFVSTGNNDPYDLLAPVNLTSVMITFGHEDGSVSSTEFLGFVAVPNPWNGRMPVPGNGVGFTGASLALDTRSVRFDLFVTEIPEPTSLALAGVALAALGLRRRKT